MTETTGFSAAKGIRLILLVQIAIALILFAGDLTSSLPRLASAPDAPDLTGPVQPGDQRRLYDPRRSPGNPSDGIPATRDMPVRLQFDDQQGGVLLLMGEISEGDAERFQERFADPGDIHTIRLNSPGGSVPDALAIGRAIRAAGMNTEMTGPAVCLSACPYILAGGVERRVAETAYVGVHQHYFGENTALPAFVAVEDIQRGQADVMTYLAEMDIDLRLMQHSLSTPPDEIYVLVAAELEDYRLVTETVLR